jgi:thymidylate synthase ThyX
MNAREAFHLLELRTTPQGHSQYRLVAQMMHKEMERVYPWLSRVMQFVDHADYESARGDSEARQRVKERALEEKLANEKEPA